MKPNPLKLSLKVNGGTRTLGSNLPGSPRARTFDLNSPGAPSPTFHTQIKPVSPNASDFQFKLNSPIALVSPLILRLATVGLSPKTNNVPNVSEEQDDDGYDSGIGTPVILSPYATEQLGFDLAESNLEHVSIFPEAKHRMVSDLSILSELKSNPQPWHHPLTSPNSQLKIPTKTLPKPGNFNLNLKIDHQKKDPSVSLDIASSILSPTAPKNAYLDLKSNPQNWHHPLTSPRR